MDLWTGIIHILKDVVGYSLGRHAEIYVELKNHTTIWQLCIYGILNEA